MPPETPTAAQGAPEFSDAASCSAWLARLPVTDPVRCHAALAEQARRLTSAPIAAAAKLEMLELLRQPVAQAQAERAKSCRGKPLPLAAQDCQAWQDVTGMWRTLAQGYDALIDAMAATAPELAAQAHLICQRALRYTALAMFEHCHIYHAVSGELWQQLHRLYVFSENAGLAGTTVNDAPGRRTAATSCL
ncbi:MAG TPA: hypothetical protein VMN03_12120, partial [Burkholderiales bacterium]|nr:hypothetical protein [Burkholderiales bacterium]